MKIQDSMSIVTGSSGLLGRALCQALEKEGGEVTQLKARCGELPDHFDKADFFFHLGAHIPYGAMNKESAELTQANETLVQEICERLPETCHLLYASSISVYGSNGSEEPSPESAYARSKLRGEEIASRHARSTVIRFSSLYGPSMASPTFLRFCLGQAMEEKSLTLFGDGERQQNYLHVDQAAAMMIHCAQDGRHGVVHGVAGENHSNHEIALLLQELIPDLEIRFEGSDATPSTHVEADRLLLDATQSSAMGLRRFFEKEIALRKSL